MSHRVAPKKRKASARRMKNFKNCRPQNLWLLLLYWLFKEASAPESAEDATKICDREGHLN